MSAREWAPGTVADATVSPGLRVRALKVPEGWRWVTDDGRDGFSTDDSPSFRDVRPLVVLDLYGCPIPDLVEKLSAAAFEGIAQQIRKQTRDPKPEMPTGFGAVVEDSRGDMWVRVNFTHWQSDASPNNRQTWGEIDAARVLSEGVERAPEAGEGA